MATKTKAVAALTLEQVKGVGMVQVTDVLPVFLLGTKRNGSLSYGWFGNGKAVVKLPGLPSCPCDAQLRLTVIHSKPGSEKQPDCTWDDVEEVGALMAADVMAGITAEAKEFSTGSYGFYVNAKVALARKGSIPVRCQVQGQLVVCGSKPAAK